ncbi:GAF domain-containing protein [Oculatella sp. LEGE 06141]|uniref:GAF domain-containing protein n=1 Tax=Oculatella sp. LEGE 06141 TaxID=1828648 RepID=UPI001881B3D6|nr:GAF domain-containing protein [Oculatella sp. LEGE 06141]MBE9181792.1 GAF domain-containing protein [Oculatella sp. LEGE 06141]
MTPRSSIEYELPPRLESVFATDQSLDALLTALMPAICDVLACDRTFLYLRNPETGHGSVTHCFCADPQWDNLAGASWIEADDIADTDPLMAIAFRTAEAVFVDDIETGGPALVNLAYEQESFKHRALIHAPIYNNGHLFGILEPCVFDLPRIWTDENRRIIAALQERMGSLAEKYVHQIKL